MFPISSVEVAADSITKASSFPAFLTSSFITNSAIGLRQIFPWQTKSSRCLIVCSVSEQEHALYPVDEDTTEIADEGNPCDAFQIPAEGNLL